MDICCGPSTFKKKKKGNELEKLHQAQFNLRRQHSLPAS
jgi:hypothetical protein